jgi:lambda family phage tail tape measure protein
MANFIGRLGVVLGLDSAEFSRGIDAAGQKLESFSNAAEKYGKVAAVALVAAGAAALKYADDIADTAAANEVAIDSVLKLRNALANSGGSAENAGKLMASFTAQIDKAADGGFEVQQTFKKMGLSLDDLRKMDMDTMFNKAVEGLAEMTDPITRNAKAMELFGKAAKGVDFVELNEQLKAGAGVSDEQAQGIKAAADAYDMLAQAARDFSLVLATEIGPPLKSTLEYFKNIRGEGNLLAESFKVTFQTVAVVLSDVEFVIGGIYRQTQRTISLFSSFLPNTNVEGMSSRYIKEAEEARQKLDEFQRRIMGVNDGGAYRGMRNDDSQTKPAAKGNLRTVVAGIDKEAVAAEKKRKDEAEKERKRLEDAAKKQLDLELRGLDEENKQREETNRLQSEQETMYQRGNAAQAVAQELAGIALDREKERLILADQGRKMLSEDLQFAQAALEIEYKRKDAAQAITDNQTLDQEARAKAYERNNALAAQALELETKRLELAKQMREGSLADGFRNAAEATFRNASTEFERGQQVFQSVMGSMESALDNFVRTGKLNFKDFARSIIADLIAIQLKAQAMAIFKMAISAFSGSPTIPMQPGGGYADGGEPPVGRVSLVGERGPELFVPKTAGTIIPNHQLASAMGGGQTVNYNGPFIASMNAIDTQSGLQFLAKNKQSVWAAYQSANRSVPMSR